MKKRERYILLLVNLTIVLFMSLSNALGSSTIGANPNYNWTYEADTGLNNFDLNLGTSTFAFAIAFDLYYKIDWSHLTWSYPTVDFTTVPNVGGLCAYGSWATNYKDPAHDYDDDNSDGCNEEVEVTATSWEDWPFDKVKTNKNYYFWNYFDKQIGSFNSKQLHMNHQMSVYDPYHGEWQALLYDLIAIEYYSFTRNPNPPCSGSWCPESAILETDFNTITKNDFNSITKNNLHRFIDINTKSIDKTTILGELPDLQTLYETEISKISNIKRSGKIQIYDGDKTQNDILGELNKAIEDAKELARIVKSDKAYSVITFDKPLSAKAVSQFVQKNNIRITEFEGLGIDTRGDEVVFGGTASTSNKITSDDFQAVTSMNIDVDGIYAIWAEIPIKKINSILKDSNVKALDLRGFNLHLLSWIYEDVRFIPTIDYEINDLYWKLL